MLTFHTWVRSLPKLAQRSGDANLENSTYPTLTIPPESQEDSLSVSFEEVGEALSKFERMYFEPDGSFVWVGNMETDATAWQLDGNLYDRDGKVVHLELKGSCPADALDRVLTTLGWPEAALMFELPQFGVVLDEAAFREYAAKPRG